MVTPPRTEVGDAAGQERARWSPDRAVPMRRKVSDILAVMIVAPSPLTLPLGAEVTVRALKFDRIEYRRWSARLRDISVEQVVLGATFGPEVEGRTPFFGGDLAVEFFYTARNYNVIAGFSPAGEPRGCYCNICLPAQIIAGPRGGEVHFVDLDIDVVVAPDGECSVTDEEEFVANSARYHYPSAVQAAARAAVAELLAAVALRQSPFDSLGLPAQ